MGCRVSWYQCFCSVGVLGAKLEAQPLRRKVVVFFFHEAVFEAVIPSGEISEMSSMQGTTLLFQIETLITSHSQKGWQFAMGPWFGFITPVLLSKCSPSKAKIRKGAWRSFVHRMK